MAGGAAAAGELAGGLDAGGAEEADGFAAAVGEAAGEAAGLLGEAAGDDGDSAGLLGEAAGEDGAGLVGEAVGAAVVPPPHATSVVTASARATRMTVNRTNFTT